jgi:hypothetical protein
MLLLGMALGYAVVLLFVIGLCASARRGDEIHRKVVARWLSEGHGPIDPEHRRAA